MQWGKTDNNGVKSKKDFVYPLVISARKKNKAGKGAGSVKRWGRESLLF